MKLIDYICGHIIYYIYYSRFKNIIPKFILEQYDFRIAYMNRICYYKGSCKSCGCKTTALQMIYRSCKSHCYPNLQSPKEWRRFKSYNSYLFYTVDEFTYYSYELKREGSSNVLYIIRYYKLNPVDTTKVFEEQRV